MYWKIKNISDQPSKVSVALASNKSPGIILQPKEFVIALPKMTTMLDAQLRRGFVEIEKGYENKLQFPIGIAIDKEEEMDIDEIKEMIKKFKK
jgi:hypothetical protein|tara:strand:- start:22066 stop:22344 length:279 start_codon:yes stop_codon:yes gene_type:complete